MMIPIVRRAVVIVVIVIPVTHESMMPAAIRHPAMLHRHMRVGKKPAEQKQESDETFVRGHGGTYRRAELVLSTPLDLWNLNTPCARKPLRPPSSES